MNMIDDDWIYTTHDQHLPSKGDPSEFTFNLLLFYEH